MNFDWGNKPELDRPGYEVSTAGDSRFSAFNARIVNPWRPEPAMTEPAMTEQEKAMSRNISIEYAYQVHVKGHRSILEGKGKRPKKRLDTDQLWAAYLGLWVNWADANPGLIQELHRRATAAGGLLTDQFARTVINQARALAWILNNRG